MRLIATSRKSGICAFMPWSWQARKLSMVPYLLSATTVSAFDFCCCLMLLKQRKHQMGFVHIAGRCVGCRDDLVLAVNGPMHLVGKLGFSPIHQCRVRVGGGDIAIVLFFVGSGRIGAFGAFFQSGLRAFYSSCATDASGSGCRVPNYWRRSHPPGWNRRKIFRPSTRPASTHCRTMRSKKP